MFYVNNRGSESGINRGKKRKCENKIIDSREAGRISSADSFDSNASSIDRTPTSPESERNRMNFVGNCIVRTKKIPRRFFHTDVVGHVTTRRRNGSDAKRNLTGWTSRQGPPILSLARSIKILPWPCLATHERAPTAKPENRARNRRYPLAIQIPVSGWNTRR